MVDIVALVDEGLGNSSYLVGLGNGGALVVDPARDPRPYLQAAKSRGWRIRYAAETHLHADFVSGIRELAALGTSVLGPAQAAHRFSVRGLGQGDELDLGGLTLRALATPGHTPEHLAYLLLDGAEPVAVFSGGTLMVGGIARPDLIGPEHTEPLARAAYRSIRDRLLTLPDTVELLPTHGAGSFCSAGDASERTSTIGAERRTNPLLLADDEDGFVARVLNGLGGYPPYFLSLRAINRDGPAVLGLDPAPLPRLSVTHVQNVLAGGAAELIDVRSITDFARGHVPGALSIPLRAQFATWLGWLVPLDRALMFVCADETDRDALVTACRGIGADRLLGELEGGVDAWEQSGGQITRTALIGPDEDTAGRRILDVRQQSEWDRGHLIRATHVELGSLPSQTEAVPPGPVLLHCAHGERAMTAASVLERAGRRDVAVLGGKPADLG